MTPEELATDFASVCRCDCAYVGAQAAGTPTRCETCRGLVDDVAARRMDAVYAESLARLKAQDERDYPPAPDCANCDKRISQKYAGTFFKAPDPMPMMWVHDGTGLAACGFAEPRNTPGSSEVL